jgi:hypothetical protein
MSYVRLQKLRAVDDPVAGPGDPSTYPYGKLPDKCESLPRDYTFEGWLVHPPVVGKRVAVIRLVRNGIRRPGVFWSTRVTKVEPGHFHTLNSVYRIDLVVPFSEAAERNVIQGRLSSPPSEIIRRFDGRSNDGKRHTRRSNDLDSAEAKPDIKRKKRKVNQLSRTRPACLRRKCSARRRRHP